MTNVNVPVDPSVLASVLSAAGWTVTAPVVVVVPPPSPPPPAGVSVPLKIVISQNGESPWPQDYSYAGTDIKSPGGDGNPYCRMMSASSLWEGYQPSNTNGVSTDFTACDNIVVSIKGPKGTPMSMQFLRAGDVSLGTSFAFTLQTDHTWERFSVPRAVIMKDKGGVDWSASIYKGAIQSHSGKLDIFCVDNWGGV